MKRLFTALAATIGLCGAVTANAQAPLAQAKDAPAPTFDETQVIDEIDGPTLQTIIARIGATTAPLDDEENTLRVGYPNGMRGVARRMACVEGESCKGLILLGYFSRPQGIPEARAQAAPRQFGLEQNLASVVINDEGEHVVKAYVIFDGGITMANLAVRIGLFGESILAYQRTLYGQAE